MIFSFFETVSLVILNGKKCHVTPLTLMIFDGEHEYLDLDLDLFIGIWQQFYIQKK